MKLYLSSHQLKLPNSLRGASYMVLSACFFAITAGLIRFATSEVHPFEAAFLRSFSGFLFMLPEKDTQPLKMSVEEGLKMIISFGMTNPESFQKPPLDKN